MWFRKPYVSTSASCESGRDNCFLTLREPLKPPPQPCQSCLPQKEREAHPEPLRRERAFLDLAGLWRPYQDTLRPWILPDLVDLFSWSCCSPQGTSVSRHASESCNWWMPFTTAPTPRQYRERRHWPGACLGRSEDEREQNDNEKE